MVILVPLDTKSKWAAVENIVKSTIGYQPETNNDQVTESPSSVNETSDDDQSGPSWQNN